MDQRAALKALLGPKLDLGLTDSRLGRNFWKLWVEHLAERRNARPAFVIAAIERDTRANLDVQASDLIPLEKAAKKAAEGRFAEAGKIIRDYLVRGALNIAHLSHAERNAKKERDKRMRGPKAAGYKKALQGKESKDAIARAWNRLASEGRPERGRAKKIAKELDLSVDYVREIINALGLRLKTRTS